MVGGGNDESTRKEKKDGEEEEEEGQPMEVSMEKEDTMGEHEGRRENAKQPEEGMVVESNGEERTPSKGKARNHMGKNKNEGGKGIVVADDRGKGRGIGKGEHPSGEQEQGLSLKGRGILRKGKELEK